MASVRFASEENGVLGVIEGQQARVGNPTIGDAPRLRSREIRVAVLDARRFRPRWRSPIPAPARGERSRDAGLSRSARRHRDKGQRD